MADSACVNFSQQCYELRVHSGIPLWLVACGSCGVPWLLCVVVVVCGCVLCGFVCRVSCVVCRWFLVIAG